MEKDSEHKGGEIASGRIEIDPRFFDKVLPELVEKGVLNVRQSTTIQALLREEGPVAAAGQLIELLKSKELDMEAVKRFADKVNSNHPKWGMHIGALKKAARDEGLDYEELIRDGVIRIKATSGDHHYTVDVLK